MIKEYLLKHPKPQQYRTSWKSLNGEWDFAFDFDNVGNKDKWWLSDGNFDKKIIVPFVYQSELSLVKEKKSCSVVWYKRDFDINIVEKKAYILHFGAVDYKAEVWINDTYVGNNENGFFEFEFDITDYIENGINKIVVRVEDHTKPYHNLGKQTYRNETFKCWYTRTTGIWQEVWVEEVGHNYIEGLFLTPRLEKSDVEIDIRFAKTGDYYLKTEIFYNDIKICESENRVVNERLKYNHYLSTTDAEFRLYYWSPSSPDLYDIKFTLREGDTIIDEMESYFGMRKVDIREGSVTLNNQKVFHKMILDQGYFGKGLMTPPDISWLHDDVLKMKEMGFNGVRKHQKIEDNRFIYLCDAYGLIMWAELPSFYEYSFESSAEVGRLLSKFVKKHYNSPAVCAYLLFNESWGLSRVYDSKDVQNLVVGSYYMIKSLDNTRLVIGNDGWEHTITDILTIHDYNNDEKQIAKIYANKEEIINSAPSKTANRYNYVPGYEYTGEPIFISEYGGIAYETESSKEYDTWGYGERIVNPEQVLDKIKKLTHAFTDNEYIAGICYTQLSDVEQEVNGLLDHDHKYKFDVNKIKEALSTGKNGGFITK